MSDMIRDRLSEMGIVVEDTRDGRVVEAKELMREMSPPIWPTWAMLYGSFMSALSLRLRRCMRSRECASLGS